MSDLRKESVTRLRVRYAETDAMGWVYYGRYYDYFEVSRSELIRNLWKSYGRIEDEDGLKLPVVESGCKYFSGARYEDELDIHATLTLKGVRLYFDYTVARSGESDFLATGFTVHCFVDAHGKPTRPPQSFLEFMRS